MADQLTQMLSIVLIAAILTLGAIMLADQRLAEMPRQIPTMDEPLVDR